VTDPAAAGQYRVMERLQRTPADGVPPGHPRLEEIYDREFAYVWQTLRRLGVGAAELEDVAHDVFVVVHRRLGDFDPTRALRPWLFGIAYRVASEHRRRPARAARQGAAAVDAAELADPAPSPERLAASEQARRQVARALDQLPLDQRAVVVLHDIDGASVPEIARALEVPLNTVYSRLRLGRAKFVAAVAAEIGDGELR
jgi:RNA polymerase sigma-70 factor (ECF subfamily)